MINNCENNLENKNNIFIDSKIVFYILWTLLLLWRIPFINKGIDYTDTGFSLANYYNVFNGNGINGIGIFFTTLIGGYIYKILPGYQLLVYRILHWLLYVLVDIIAYKQFKKYLKPNIILLALLSLSLFSKSGEAIFSYYPLTKLLLISAIILLINGIVENDKRRIFFSGLLCGLNVFVRLPNILFCSMILGIILYGVWTKQNKKDVIHKAHIYFYGAFTGFLVGLAVVVLFMGTDEVIESFMGYVNLALGKTENDVVNFLGVEETSGHSITAIIRTVCIQCFYGLKDMLICGLPMLAIAYLIQFIFRKSRRPALIYTVTAILELAFLFRFGARLSSTITYIRVLIMLFLTLIMCFLMKNRNQEHRLIYFTTLLISICCIFGSDLGLNRVGMLQGIVVIVIFMAVMDLREISNNRDNYSIKITRATNVLSDFSSAIASIVVLAMFFVAISIQLPKTYMDANVRELTESVNDEITVLRGMKTSEVRAAEINEYYEIMHDESLENHEAAIFGYFPLGFVIGPQHDYFEAVQPCVDYPSVSVESLLSVIEQKSKEEIYPIIVLSHVNQIQREDDHDTSEAKLAVMGYMLTLTDYDCRVDDQYFTVYVPRNICTSNAY